MDVLNPARVKGRSVEQSVEKSVALVQALNVVRTINVYVHHSALVEYVVRMMDVVEPVVPVQEVRAVKTVR